MTNAKKLRFSGVLNVDSFDDQEIILETDQGLLAMRGEGSAYQSPEFRTGRIDYEGFLLELAYSEERNLKRKDRGKSF